MSQKVSLDGDVLSLREAEDVGVEGEGCALVSTYTLVGVPSSRRGPTLRSSWARRRLGLDQPTAVIQGVRLDTGNENHLSPMEMRYVAR